ncbi:hypothetical protein [Actinokineospora xionganensis]
MVCERLDTGRYVGVDRSATAITTATTRNAESVAAGTARFVTAALGELDPSSPPHHDRQATDSRHRVDMQPFGCLSWPGRGRSWTRCSRRSPTRTAGSCSTGSTPTTG